MILSGYYPARGAYTHICVCPVCWQSEAVPDSAMWAAVGSDGVLDEDLIEQAYRPCECGGAQ